MRFKRPEPKSDDDLTADPTDVRSPDDGQHQTAPVTLPTPGRAGDDKFSVVFGAKRGTHTEPAAETDTSGASEELLPADLLAPTPRTVQDLREGEEGWALYPPSVAHDRSVWVNPKEQLYPPDSHLATYKLARSGNRIRLTASSEQLRGLSAPNRDPEEFERIKYVRVALDIAD